MSRRSFFVAGGLGAATVAATASAANATGSLAGSVGSAALGSDSLGGDGPTTENGVTRGALKFRQDGSFTIVQFNDTQDNHNTDERTLQLQEAVLDDQEPDFVVINGDLLNGDMTRDHEVRQALNNQVLPMEERGIKWAATMGNHEEDSVARGTNMTEDRILEFLQRYEHNVNIQGAAGVHGHGNQALVVDGADGSDAFVIWLLDSGRYSEDEINGQPVRPGYPHWDYMRPSQVEWYRSTSQQLEQSAGGLVPGLMYIHIPLWEYMFMWNGGVDNERGHNSDLEEMRSIAQERHGIEGVRHEAECPGPFNPGMYLAIQERGDVKGVFCGHEHINTYVGDYYGVQLGYGPGTGFTPYGLGGGADRNSLRGSRVFKLDQNAVGVYTDTYNLFAADYGIDTTNPQKQPSQPRDFPDYIL